MSGNRYNDADNFDRTIRRRRFSETKTGCFNTHRAVWAPGVKTRRQAALYINKRIEEQARAMDAEKILDLSCGAGSVLIDLAKARDARYAGLTLSRFRKQTGDERILRQGLQEKIRIFEGDFRDPKVFRLFPDQDLIYAVESFSELQTEAEIAPLITENLVPGGRVVICDYMLSEEEERLEDADTELLALLRSCGYAPGIQPAREWIGGFEDAGLETIAAEDFSGWLRVHRFHPGIAKTALSLAGKTGWIRAELPAVSAVLSSMLRRGSLQYRFLVFQKNREEA